MTDTNHPITPPPELVKKWMSFNNIDIAPLHLAQALATKAARWGADQQLEACISLMLEKGWMNQSFADNLRDARRPKPPSLKEQALEALENLNGECLLEGFECPEKVATIRRALESLPD